MNIKRPALIAIGVKLQLFTGIIYYQDYIMSRADSRSTYDPIEMPLMKVNELINSIFAMNQPTMGEQLKTCSKIVGQLLQNELISHISSLGAAKLLCYQLILLIAEQNAVENRPKLSSLENAFGNNKKIKLTASMRNTLASINEIMEEMMWRNVPKKRGGTQKNIGQNTQMYQNYVQFKHLLADFDQQLQNTQQERSESQVQKPNKRNLDQEQSLSSESGQNEALIEQLQEIVAKKEKRIKQLNQELQETILEQKAQQDLIGQLQSRNIDLKEEIKLLNSRLAEKDVSQLHLQEKIQKLTSQYLTQQKQFYSRKAPSKTQKTIKTRFTIDDEEETTTKKQFKPILEQKPTICAQCQLKKDISIQDVNGLRKMLFAQALSIQALI